MHSSYYYFTIGLLSRMCFYNMYRIRKTIISIAYIRRAICKSLGKI